MNSSSRVVFEHRILMVDLAETRKNEFKTFVGCRFPRLNSLVTKHLSFVRVNCTVPRDDISRALLKLANGSVYTPV